MSDSDRENKSSLPVSAIQAFNAYGHSFFIKRDDLLGTINGNKARKLYFLLETPEENYKEIISCGGNQSNLMQSLSILANQKNWKFTYLTPPIPDWLKENPSGNYKFALDKGCRFVEITDDLNLAGQNMAAKNNTLFIPQGAHFPLAEPGIKILANELKNQLSQMANPSVDILLTSGTGTTAYYLAKNLPYEKVVTFPCVGDSKYLRKQMEELGKLPENLIILEPQKKMIFGELDIDVSDTYHEMLDAGIELDLLYDSVFWTFIKKKWRKKEPLYHNEKKILFIHSGGTFGNQSQLKRYMKEFPFIRTWRTS